MSHNGENQPRESNVFATSKTRPSFARTSRGVGEGTDSLNQSLGAFHWISVLLYYSVKSIAWIELVSLRFAGKCWMAYGIPLSEEDASFVEEDLQLVLNLNSLLNRVSSCEPTINIE